MKLESEASWGRFLPVVGNLVKIELLMRHCLLMLEVCHLQRLCNVSNCYYKYPDTFLEGFFGFSCIVIRFHIVVVLILIVIVVTLLLETILGSDVF